MDEQRKPNRAASDCTVDRPAIVDGVRLTVLPTPVRINLHNLEAVRREMARVYRGVRAKQVDSQEGARLTYILSQIGKLIELGELERRISQLESKAMQ